MLSTLLFSLAPSLVPAMPAATPVALVQEDDVAAQIAACGEDVAKLEALATSFEEAEDKSSARACYNRILEIDDMHEKAHKALRHHFYADQWFTSYAALSKFRREEAKMMKEKYGKVRYNDEWVLESELPFLRMGWQKDDSGTFVNPAIAARKAIVAEHEAAGHKLRTEDSTWIAKEDFPKWEEQKYLVDGEWVTKAEANAHHAEIDTPWLYQGQHFVAVTTTDVDTAAWVAWYADGTYRSLYKIFGVYPDDKPKFACLSSLTQYNEFAAGDQAAQRQATESTGFSSCHYSYLADLWFDVSNQELPEYVGGGVGYFDVNDPSMQPWGPYSVRHAAGLSYVESIDRAWGIISQFLTGGAQGGNVSPDMMWDEKRIPKWLAYGAASYVERFFKDESNEEDPWAIQVWSMGQLANTGNGKLDPLEDIFRLPLDLADLEASTRYIHQAGLVTAFMMHGDCKPVMDAHMAFKKAMQSGESTAESVAALEQALKDNQDKLVEFSSIKFATEEERAKAAPTGEAF